MFSRPFLIIFILYLYLYLYLYQPIRATGHAGAAVEAAVRLCVLFEPPKRPEFKEVAEAAQGPPGDHAQGGGRRRPGC